MKNTFKHFYELPDDELKTVWKNCIFVLDTSVLLRIYEFSEDTRNGYIELLSGIQDRVWLPYQVALEFNIRKPHVIANQRAKCEKLEKISSDEKIEINNKFERILLENQFITDSDNIQIELENNFDKFIDNIQKCKEYYSDLLDDDKIGKQIDEIFSGKIGEDFSKDDESKVIKEGDYRNKYEIPPGYMDKNKSRPGKKYGDIKVWCQILNHAEATKKPVILITDDKKEDWWRLYNSDVGDLSNEIISPHYLLIEEFKRKTGNDCCIYTSVQFYKMSQKFLDTKIIEKQPREINKLIEEIEKVSNYNKLSNSNDSDMHKLRNLFNHHIPETNYPEDDPEYLDVSVLLNKKELIKEALIREQSLRCELMEYTHEKDYLKNVLKCDVKDLTEIELNQYKDKIEFLNHKINTIKMSLSDLVRQMNKYDSY